VTRWLHKGAHVLLGLAMVPMVWPVVPGWLSLAVAVPVAAWFVGLVALRRRPADVHHAVMAGCMAWMAAMPAATAMSSMPGPCHGATGPVTGAVAGYFLLAAAPFLAAPFRIGQRVRVLGPLGHAAMSLGMAALLAPHA
jgi:hypothetical protein